DQALSSSQDLSEIQSEGDFELKGPENTLVADDVEAVLNSDEKNAEDVLKADVKGSKIHDLIRAYMGPDKEASERAIKDLKTEFEQNYKETCTQTVEYISQGGKGQIDRFGTLFSLMNLDARYATKGNIDLLKGITSGINMRERDANGTFKNVKTILTADMLCKGR
ncbi:MAG: hypothetical protein Q8K36_06185, partial [Alphaproteobacteria bacterium]|nr:hypothetical protein [Alphaproteobacteria bacterium]